MQYRKLGTALVSIAALAYLCTGCVDKEQVALDDGKNFENKTKEIRENTEVTYRKEDIEKFEIASINQYGNILEKDISSTFLNVEQTIKEEQEKLKQEQLKQEQFVEAEKKKEEQIKEKSSIPDKVGIVEEIVPTIGNPYYNKVEAESSNTASVAQLCNNIWNTQVPDNIKAKLIDNGWRLLVSNQKLMNRFGYSYSIAGITDCDVKTIYIDNRKSCPNRALIHEVGHAIDNISGDVSDSQEFIAIFNEEKYNFVDCTAVGDGHETSNNNEYFASVFQNIIINNEKTVKSVPKTCEFIMRYMQ